MLAGCSFPSELAFSALAIFSRATAISTGANSGAPDPSARCKDAFATAIFSFGTGLLAHAASDVTATTAATAPISLRESISMMFSSPSDVD
jgi:hypothetical protein